MKLTLTPENIIPRKGPDPARAAVRPENSRLSLQKFIKRFNFTPPHWSFYAERFVRLLLGGESRLK